MNSTVTPDSSLQIGRGNNFASVFTLICLQMTREEVYARMPIYRLQDLAAVLQKGDYRIAVDDAGKLKGVLLWKGVRDDVVPLLIKEKRVPTVDEIDPAGNAKVITGLFGNDRRALLKLSREFSAMQRGNYVFFERHFGKGANRSSEFGWAEPSGKVFHAGKDGSVTLAQESLKARAAAKAAQPAPD